METAGKDHDQGCIWETEGAPSCTGVCVWLHYESAAPYHRKLRSFSAAFAPFTTCKTKTLVLRFHQKTQLSSIGVGGVLQPVLRWFKDEHRTVMLWNEVTNQLTIWFLHIVRLSFQMLEKLASLLLHEYVQCGSSLLLHSLFSTKCKGQSSKLVFSFVLFCFVFFKSEVAQVQLVFLLTCYSAQHFKESVQIFL